MSPLVQLQLLMVHGRHNLTGLGRTDLNKAALAIFSMPVQSVPVAVLASNFSPTLVHAAAYEHPSRADLAVIEPVPFSAMLFRSTCNLSASIKV